jgi:hypothetical protein
VSDIEPGLGQAGDQAPSIDPPAAAIEPPAPGKRKRGRVLAGVAAVAIVAAGTAVTVKLASGQSSGGAATPEQAVEHMVGSLEENDLLGMIDVFAPWERDFARDEINKYLDDAKQNDLLAKDADLAAFSGYTLSVDGLQVKADEVNERISNVAIVGGTAHFQSQLKELPVGAKVLEQLNKANDGQAPDDVDTTADLADAELPPLTTIKQDGRWYVSLFYTIAEAARRDAGAPAPSTAERVPAKGESSPAAAVDEMIDALEHGDARRLVALAPPDEMAVLHDYAPLFLQNIEPSQDRVVKVTDRQYDVVKVDGGQKVIPRKLTVEVTGDNPGTLAYERTDDHVQLTLDQDGAKTVLRLEQAASGSSFVLQGDGVDLKGTISSEGESTVKLAANGTTPDGDVTADLTLRPEGTCINVTGETTGSGDSQYVDEQVCPEDVLGPEGANALVGQLNSVASLDKLGKLVQFQQLSRLFDLGVVTVKVGSSWYVSPLRTTGELLGTFAHLTDGL